MSQFFASGGQNVVDSAKASVLPMNIQDWFPLGFTGLIVQSKGLKFGFKLNIQKTKIMASGPITSWQIDRETMETVGDFISLSSKIIAEVTAAMKLKDTCSLEEKLWPT